MSYFRDGLYQLKLNHEMVDLGNLGLRYTWCNGHKDNQLIPERLDKGIANGEWTTLFPRALVRNLPSHSSDHAPLLLITDGAHEIGSRPFRFEHCWTRDESSKGIVEGAWRATLSLPKML